MTVLSAQSIRRHCQTNTPEDLLYPFRDAYGREGLSGGLSSCSYDIILAEDHLVWPQRFFLASAIEHFNLPHTVMGVVHDKSTLVRAGLTVQNTLLDPGWSGFLTLELRWNRWIRARWLRRGTPIAQVKFEWLDAPTDLPYRGKYQKQEAGPQEARFKDLSAAVRPLVERGDVKIDAGSVSKAFGNDGRKN